MSFSIGLSGLNAASADLSITSNNISNVGTTGFKESRAEFADVYAVSPFGNARTAIGSGVLLSNVAQQFTQGNLEFTENSLDLAVNGPGFFVLTASVGNENRLFSRAGAFGIDDQGFVVNSAGQFLQTFPVNPDGTTTSTSLSSTSPLQLPSAGAAAPPSATTEVDIGMNLPVTATALDPLNFDPTVLNTFTNSTSVTVFDSLGDSHVATSYFVKDNAATNQWAAYFYVDGAAVNIPGGTAGSPASGPVNYATLNFDPNGSLITPTTPDPIAGAPIALTTGASALNLSWDFANNSPTQFSSDFAVTFLGQDGSATGRLSGLEISEEGVALANFTNGQAVALGKVALANFTNPQGLQPLGNTAWTATLDSGEPLAGEANTGSFGPIRSGALEASNVDLTAELVSLITAQRNFQANAKSIETNSAITQTIINIR